MAVVIDDVVATPVIRSGVVEPVLTALTGSSANSGIKFPNDGRTWVRCKSTGGVTVVTLTTQQTVDGLVVTAPTVSIADGVIKDIGPFSASIFDIATGTDAGKVQLTVDVPTQFTYTVFRV